MRDMASATEYDDQGSTSPRRIKRLGYIKPSSQPFSTSAQKRSSVMSLGRIDHLQHRFARGASINGRNTNHLTSPKASKAFPPFEASLAEEEDVDDFDTYCEPTMVPLPPSPIQKSYEMSTSHGRDPFLIERTLKSDLKQLSQALETYNLHQDNSRDQTPVLRELLLKLRDCIRSARTFSSSVPTYRFIATDFAIFREDAMEALSIAKHIGECPESAELTTWQYARIQEWTMNLQQFLHPAAAFDRSVTHWLDESKWKLEDARHYAFLKFYLDDESLHDPIQDKTAFLEDLHTGTKLCKIYNAVVRRSRRPFGLIDKYHEDTSIRYRALDNLRFWRKALAYRFDVNLHEFDVNEIYYMTDAGRAQLETAIQLFCRSAIADMVLTVREVTESRDEETTAAAVEVLSI